MDSGWVYVGVILAIVAPMIVGIIMSSGETTEFANAGLEECPKSIGSSYTIWVKDCLAYTKLMVEVEKEN